MHQLGRKQQAASSQQAGAGNRCDRAGTQHPGQPLPVAGAPEVSQHRLDADSNSHADHCNNHRGFPAYREGGDCLVAVSGQHPVLDAACQVHQQVAECRRKPQCEDWNK